MPAKTGGSHAIASFVTLLAGTLLSKYLWTVAPPLGEASVAVIRTIRVATGTPIPVDERFAGAVVVMVGLSFVWGLVYHLGRHS
jgi:hypothetical protein